MKANDEWILAVEESPTLRNHISKSSKWEPPPTGWLKCNFDCSYRSNGDSGVGWIVRDESRKHVGSGMVQMTGIASSLEGEAIGFLVAHATNLG